MRVLLSTHGSRGDVEPLVGLAVRLRALGAEVRVCAPQDWAERLPEVGVPLVPVRRPSWSGRTAATPRPAADLPRRAAELVAAQFDAVAAAAGGCDALVATGMFPAAAGARSVTEKLVLRYVYASYQPTTLPSPHHPPHPWPGRPLPHGRRRARRRRGHDDVGSPGRRASGGDTPGGGPAILGRPGGRPGHRHGTAHDGPAPTTESLSAALRTTLTPETRARAAAVASTIRTDGAAVAATLLVDAVSRERPPVPA